MTLGISTVYLSLIVLIPIAAVIAEAFSGGWASFWAAVTAPEAVAALKLTFTVSLIVVAINAVSGTLIAWVLVRDSFRGKSVVNAVIDLPFALPTIVAGLTLLACYGPQSPFGVNVAFTKLAIGLALLFVTLPFITRAVQPVLLELDREMEEAATSLGASPFTTFRRIVLPNLLPAILSGAALGFGRAIGEFGAVILISGNIPFETEVSSWYIFSQIESDRSAAAAAVSVVLLATLSRRARRGRRGRALDAEARSVSRYLLRFSALGYLLFLLLIPVGMVFYRMFEDGLAAVWGELTSPAFIHALQVTLVIAAIAVPANTIFGILCALAIVRRGSGRGNWFLNSAIGLPLALSPVVVGLSLILVYGKSGWIGSWLTDHGIRIIFSLPGMVLATIFVSLPFVVREVVPVLREIGTDQEEAAWTLGASRTATFWRITLPAIRWGVAYGIVLTTARALGEYGAVAVVSGRIAGKTETLTLHIDERFLAFDQTGVYTTAVVLALIAVSTLVAMNLLGRKERARGDHGAADDEAVR